MLPFLLIEIRIAVRVFSLIARGENTMKRVYTLYRVSTTRQVDVVKDDIPMHDFADRFPDWEIIQEFEEKGISGYLVYAIFPGVKQNTCQSA